MKSNDYVSIAVIAGLCWLLLSKQHVTITPESEDQGGGGGGTGSGSMASMPDDNTPQQLYGVSLPYTLTPLYNTDQNTNIIAGTSNITKSLLIAQDPKIAPNIYSYNSCGDKFSIPNNDKENSVTNYWYNGNAYYMQSTGALVKSVPVLITKQQYDLACAGLPQIKLT